MTAIANTHDFTVVIRGQIRQYDQAPANHIFMDLSYINHNRYPRAVNASVEGRLRHGESEQEFATYSTSGQPQRVTTEHGQSPISSRPNQPQQRQGRQEAAHGRNPDSTQAMGGYSGNPAFGEQMAVASRQARQAHAHRSYTPPARVSTRGQEANRRYLETSLSNQHRFIDEMV